MSGTERPPRLEPNTMYTATCCADSGGFIKFDEDGVRFIVRDCGPEIKTTEQATELLLSLSQWIMNRKAEGK